MLKKRLCLFIKLLALIHGVAALLPETQDIQTTSSSLQEECASRCPDIDLNQNRTDDSASEIGCGTRCKIDQCSKGCAAWQLALHTSCQTVCNRTSELLPPKELYCMLGCHDALNRYFQQLKAEIGVPPAPALVADSLTATSLRLEWKGIDIERRGQGISYLVQWRYEELAETWQYCRNQTWGEDDQILVENLQPYTKYRFRVALLLKSTQHNTEPIVSAPSVVILTLAAGLPASAPVILRAAAVDSCRISVSWEPGPFPNGPLLSYVLRLQGAQNSQLKDIAASENTDHYMFQNLKPNVNYSISVTMRNGVGEGPAAVKYISTTPEPAVKDTQQPILILGGEHEVMKQGADMLDEPSVIYRTNSTICGVAIHVASAQLYISDSTGYVYRTSIMESSPPEIVLNSNQTNFKPLSLSVDWLNSHLYVLGEVKHATTVWQLARCTLNGRDLRVAMAVFLTRPSHIEVDPYNGYLFWVTRGGLYRLDLDAFNGAIKQQIQPYLILEDAYLGAFAVDHTNFRLLVPHHAKNTVLSVSLDGKEVIDLRGNTQKPKFKNVVSLTMANGLFYWTNGDEVLTEGYHSGQNRYFHNAYPDKPDGSFVSVNILMDASQPVPVPVNPPTGVQAVLGADRAKVSWQQPHLLGGQGKGAWQDWNYELEIRDESDGQTIHQINITGSSYTVRNLKQKSGYLIKAAAYTTAGRGPWSTEFRGHTLRDGLHASILWSSSEGLLKSDLTGESIDTLISKASLKDGYQNAYHIVDVSWFKDVLYLVGNNSALYQYNITSHEKTKLNINSVGSVAVDWVSKKLYWANPKQQIITRANLNGSQQEPMSILAIVKELLIDSVEAYLYWSTGHAVEVARLNGQDRRYYHSDEIFNGKQVMGLTLDTENRYVYWIVRSYESGSIVYRAATSEKIPFKQKIFAEKMSTLQYPNIQGPLCYFSQHLLWLQDDQNAVIGDLYGQNTAAINGITLSGLHMVAIMDRTMHRYPNNLTSETIRVRPNAVDVNSIRVEGSWRNFNISWDPVNNTNYGTVFYEVKFVDYINTNSNPEITTQTSIAYNNSEQILPYSVLEISVKAFNYWEAAHHSRKIVRSPESIPSQPVNPRAFVEYQKDPLSEKMDIYAIFRWDSPEFTNGLIQGYTVQCWYVASNAEIRICDSKDMPASKLECRVHDLIPNMTYYFQVQAYTKVGAGPYTDTIQVNTGNEHPLPQLLVAAGDSVRIFDLDRKDNYTITRHIAVEITYSAIENKIYWINELQELVTSDMSGSNASKILTLNNTAHSLCVDWVSRSLFWTESSYNESSGNYIVKLDLTAWEADSLQYKVMVTRSRKMINLNISPLTGSLYWVELSKNDRGVIMQSDLFGNNIVPFFNHMEDCSCPYHPLVRPVITVDNTDPHNLVLYWVSLEGNLHIADLDGCVCNSILSLAEDSALPATSLTVDQTYIYWSNAQDDKLYYIDKVYIYENEIQEFRMGNSRTIRALGQSLQPYPNSECLVPYQTTYRLTQVSKTANSIRIKLPEPVSQFACAKFNLPATLYTIYVTCSIEDTSDNCDDQSNLKFQTYDSEITIDKLKPYTKYKFTLSVSNFYVNSDYLNLDTNGVILRTAAGAPSKPQNVTVQPLTPTLAAVQWMPPKILNAEAVRYEVHWRSVQLVNGVRPKAEQLIKHTERPKDGRFSAMLNSLLPGHEYLVYVRAYPAQFNDTFSQSEEQALKMFPEPNNLTLTNASVNAINISWLSHDKLTSTYGLQYTEVGLEKWKLAANYTHNKDKVAFLISNLQSRTLYKFRLFLKYRNYSEPFIWPDDGRFTFQTLGDVPSAPGIPIVTKLRNSVFQLNWEPAHAHGSQITLYRLEGKQVDETDQIKSNNQTERWILYYNGTDNYWIIIGDMNQKYHFRVQARNAYGFGAWSEQSLVIDLAENNGAMIAAQQHLGLTLGLSVPVIVIMLLCFCYILCLYKKRKQDKKNGLNPMMSDVELATLREIPRGNFVQSNALYASAVQDDSDDSMLPKIRRDQITLAKFLGSGAFGEVFQGNAKDLEGPGMTPVAIKTLRKGATAQEKTEFLQEARLMSHFRHKHVLRLLGICLDTDPPLLVLELMEAGDLLSYLRASRSLPPTAPNSLRMQDLLAMCEDVARGCRYLEELHFVHRDLACRNCLVSARDRDNRVVKIGDFGLARDIYKNDYYRKEGEGLLPVRWMAPESLVDGVFTSQSDVWAFGVLMWEITSLGQQPYPARTNLEVLHHVRAGGRLLKPLNCPSALHQLMLQCWSAADDRPSFKVILEHIISLRNNIDDTILSPVHAGHYLARRGVSNMAYFADENHNHNSGNSRKSSSSEGSRDLQPFLHDSQATTAVLQSVEVPKYLELLADNEELLRLGINGYEVPRSICLVRPNKINVTDSQTSELSTEMNLRSDEQLSLKRSSITSLDLLDCKRTSIYSIGNKSKTLDNLKTASPSSESTFNRDSLTSLSDWRRYKKNVIGERGSETSLEAKSSSISSAASLTSSTRPSSSLINSHTLPLTNAHNFNDPKNTSPIALKTNLQNGKPNIPLVINSALLNLLKQSPNIDDNSDQVVAYSNVNPDAIRINGV